MFFYLQFEQSIQILQGFMIIFKVKSIYVLYIYVTCLVANFKQLHLCINVLNLSTLVLWPMTCKAKPYVTRMLKSLDTPL
jgi:hypothetical protein